LDTGEPGLGAGGLSVPLRPKNAESSQSGENPMDSQLRDVAGENLNIKRLANCHPEERRGEGAIYPT